MISNFFFKKKIKANSLFPKHKIKNNFEIENVKPLHLASRNDLTFFDSIRYKSSANNTKAGLCITTDKLKAHLPKNSAVIIVKNVLLELAKVLKKIYPNADIDYPDFTLKKPLKKFKSVKFGNNVLIGKNVKIGKNSSIGSNTIIEQCVKMAKTVLSDQEILSKIQ